MAFWDAMRTGVVQNALKEGNDGAGGYLVPDTYDEKLVKALAEKNVLRKIGSTVSPAQKLHIPVASGIGGAAWVVEGKEYSFGDVTFDRVAMDAHKLAVSILVSDEMLEDSGIDLETYIEEMFGESIGDAEEYAFIHGTGGGMPLGLVHQAPIGVISQNDGTVNVDDIIDLMYSVKRPYREKAAWLLSEDIYRILRNIKIHNGIRLWEKELEKGEPQELFGRPIYVCKHLDKVVPGGIPAMFGDFRYFWIGDRGKRVIKRLSERFADRGQVAFIASERVDAKLVLPEAVKMLKVKGTEA